MGLSFLVPAFLAGIIGLAIPIIIHLTNRDRRDVVRFPSLMFLRQIPFKTVRRQRIRHWWLFLLRALALVALVLAFARPLLDSGGTGGNTIAGARDVVILLDRSFSMGYEDRWQRALDAATDVVDGLGPDDRASVVTFSDDAEAIVQPTNDPLTLKAALDRTELSAGGTRYAPAVRVANQILEDSELSRKQVVLVTDFQRVGWNRDSDLTLPPGTELTRVDLSTPDAANLAVTDVTLDRVTTGARQRVTVAARVVNLGSDDVSDLDVEFEIDGQVLQRKTARIGAHSGALVRFTEVAVPTRITRGTIRAGSDRLPNDNLFHFVLKPVQPLSVLILHHPSGGTRSSLYLRRALDIGTSPAFEVTLKSTTQFGRADLAGRSVVILNDAPPRGGAPTTALLDFVADGGAVLIALGRRSPASGWPAAAQALLPGAVGAPVDRLRGRSGSLAITQFDHPVFEVFSQPRSGDFSEARITRYRQLSDTGTANALARFDDGSIALAEQRLGEGRVLVWTTDFANFWNDLPLQPVFLPFVHRVVTYLADYSEPHQWYVAGEVLDVSRDRDLAAHVFPGDVPPGETVELVIDPPSGDRYAQRISGEAPYVHLTEQGFYRIRRLRDDEALTSLVAVNLASAESDLASVDAEELAVALSTGGAVARAAAIAPTLSPEERERRQGLWWYLLVGLFLILSLETIVANRLKSVG